jgi:hypothetical protein
MSSDAYIRIGSRGVRTFGHTEHHDSLIFVDAPLGRALTSLRHASYALFSNAGTLIVRPDSPVDSPAEEQHQPGERMGDFADQIKAMELGGLQWGLLHQPVGRAPWIEGTVDDVPQVLDRARAVELEALLDWGDAVWRPATYHYRLPSGEHAAGFVRVGDAIQTPRDAEVLASWLHSNLKDEVGIVVDTGTLSALVQALLTAIRSRPDWRPGPVNVLDRYPATAHDVADAVRETIGGPGLVAVLSVNSSGHLRDALLEALGALPNPISRSLDVLINKMEITTHLELTEGITMRTWHPRPSEEPLVRYDAANADVCQLCRQARTATVISVSPRSFDGSLPASLVRITPKVEDARRNRPLWEFADGVSDAVRLEATPLDAVLEWRPPGPMPIAVDYAKLLGNAQFRAAAVSALLDELHRNRADPVAADLVLIPDHEFHLASRPALIKAMGKILGPDPRVEPFPPKGKWSNDLRGKIKAAPKCIAVVTLGAVTGTTLNGALAAIQGARSPGRYDLYAYVLHARLAEQRAWRTLQNTYDNRIFTAWQSYLPDRSPLREESATLEEISEPVRTGLSSGAQAFLSGRTDLLVSTDIDRNSELFWGAPAETELTPNSIFGQALHGPAVYVAVGSAMERARREQRGGVVPAQRVFEMPAIVRSYYDPMILAAVLRWLQPYEAWWGFETGEERSVVALMLERATTDHKLILTPELLLAGAQGKLNRPGITEVQARASSLLQNAQLSSAQKGPIELGLALLPDYDTTDAERQQGYGAQSAIEGAKSRKALLKLVPDLLRGLNDGTLPARVANDLEAKIAMLVDE